MRKPRPRLDPVTLRWFADQHEATARRYAKHSDDCARAGNQAGAWGWGDDAYSERMAAKRLRNLATRAEGER